MNSYSDVTDEFIKLGNLPSKELVNLVFPIIERFTALMYKRTTSTITMDEVRLEIFVKNGRDLEANPSTSAALLERTFRAACIAGDVYNNVLVSLCNLP